MYFKKDFFITLIFVTGLFFYSIPLEAVPAKPTPVVITQGNGEKLTIVVKGNEYFNYRTTLDGYLIDTDNEKNYYYLTLDSQGNVTLSSVAVHDVEKRNAEEKLFIETLDVEAILTVLSNNSQKKNVLKRNASSQKIEHKRTEFPTIGDIRTLVILVEFPNIEFSVKNPVEEFTRLLNEPGYSDFSATGSMRDYFYDNSGGKFIPHFDVYGPVKVSHDASYYNKDTDSNRQLMVEETCRILSESGEVDFSEYDMDNDGIVDNVYLFCAGYSPAVGADREKYIWPHKYNIYDLEVVLNGKRLNDYACSNELRGVEGDTIAAIGTFTHEFCHVLGLPDLYTTNSNVSAFTPGNFSVLDRGCYNNDQFTPCNLSAYERFCLGWTEPVELNNEPLNVGLRNIETNEAYWIKTSSEDEFFVLENRQLVGWDKYLPAHGMLVWHIDYDEEKWETNVVNNESAHQRVEIVRADGISTELTIPGDPFPGTANMTEFTDNSSTPMVTWTGEKLNKGLTEIKEENGNIFFRFKGGIDEAVTGKLEALEPTEIGEVNFTASWNPYTGNFFGYLLQVFYWDGNKWDLLEDYEHKDVGIAASYTVTGLDPATEYKYRVAVTNGYSTTEYSNEIIVKTQEAVTFEYITPQVRTYTITDESFVIDWAAISGATSYLVEVYQKEYTDPEGIQVLDFTDGTTTLNQLGWNSTGTTIRTPEGYYGEAEPSLRLDRNNTYLDSPIYDKTITYLSFWYAGRNASSGDVLSLKGYTGSRWIEIWTDNTLDVEKESIGEIIEFTSKELGNYYAISITYDLTTGSSGNLFIDDLRLEYGSEVVKNEIITETVLASSGNDRLSIEINDLQKDEYYYYTVTGLSGDSQTRPSKEVEVLVNKDLSSIHEMKYSLNVLVNAHEIFIETDHDLINTVEIYNILGHKVYRESFYQTLRIESNTFNKGVYLVKVNSEIYKIILH